MNVVCSESECPILLNSLCVFYGGANLSDTGIITNDTLQVVIQKLNDAIAISGGGTVTNVTASAPLSSTGGDTPNITISLATSVQNGYLSATNWNTFNNKQGQITLTTTGTSGAATFVADVLNIPQYQAAGTYVTSVTGTANRITSTGGLTPVIDIDAAYDALWQPVDADLTSIAALGFASTSFLKKTALNTWALDTNTYITSGSAWLLASGGTLTGINTITSNAKNQLLFDGAWTATAANDYHIRIAPIITGQGATNPNTYRTFYLTPSFTAGDNSQTFTALSVDASFDDNAKTSITKQLLTLRNAGSLRLSVNSVGTVAILSSSATGLSVAASGGTGISISTSGANPALVTQVANAMSGLNGGNQFRMDAGVGGIIYGQSWSIVPNSITTAPTKLRTDYSVKPGDNSSNITGAYFDYVVYSNTATPIITTGFEWATITAGVSTGVVMRLEGSNLGMFGATTFDTGVGVIALLNATTAPAAGDPNQCMIYCKDVAASSEFFVMDEGGFETQLS